MQTQAQLSSSSSSSSSSGSGGACRRLPAACSALRLPSSRQHAHIAVGAIACSQAARSGRPATICIPSAARRSSAPRSTAASREMPARQRMVYCRAAVAAAEPGKTTLGFVGIGIMGLAMANNLIKAGYKVVVWNRSADKCEPLKAAGAEVAASPADVARAADITFAMLSDPPAALEVATGRDGVVAGLSAGKGYVDVSTVDAATSAAIAAAVRGAGATFLEAPVSGSKGPAEQGALIFLTAGDKALFDAATPPLDVMGKAKFFLGDVGAGAHMKLVVNAVMGAMMGAYAEGLSLAHEVGLQQQDVIDVIGLGAIACPMFALKGPGMTQASYPTAFPLKHQQKDLRLALAAADAAGQPLAVIAAANDLYVRARAAGHGDADFSAVLEAVKQQQPQK